MSKIKFWTKTSKILFQRISFLVQYYGKKLLFKFKQRSPLLKKLHIDSFPAIHINKLDGLDLFLKFSSELLVLALAVFAAAMNFWYFSWHEQNFQDSSLANQLLANHIALNKKLYAKNNSIVTVVDKGGLFPQAQAQDFVGLDPLSSAAPTDDQDGSAGPQIDPTSILAPSPDSAQSLVVKQIKVYQTQAGDTLQSLSQKFGISPQTIIWANKLPSNAIKPGWQLLILPTDGILVKEDSNTTLPDVARKYKVDMDKIIAYNALDGAEDVQDGNLIIVPGGVMPEAPKPPVSKPRARTDGKVKGSGPIDSNFASDYNDGSGHEFPAGYCTWYVAKKLGGRVKWGGNAKEWAKNSKAYGAVVDRDPAPGAILVTNDSRRYGHVAYIEQVTPTSVVVSEMNYTRFGKVDTREIPLSSSIIKAIIHP